MFDKNNAGQLSASEIFSVLSFMPGFSLSAAQEIIDRHDVDRNGMMDFDEFVQFLVEDRSILG